MSDVPACSVLMICPQFRPIVGGYERAAEALSIWLVHQGIAVSVLTDRRERGWAARESLNGIDIRRVRSLYRRRTHTPTSLASFALFLILQGRRYAVWHIHQYGWHAALAIALSRLARRPVVLKLTSSGKWGIAKSGGTGPASSLMKRLLLSADACVAVSHETAREASAFGFRTDRIRMISNGVDGTKFSVASPKRRVENRTRLGLKAAGVVLYVGRFSPEKNVLGLLDAWRRVAPGAPGWTLALVGDGPERSDVDRYINEHNLAASIRLVGYTEVTVPWYQAADIFVLSSHEEGMSNTTLEAMSCGLPIVTTRVSGSHQTVDANAAGFVVDVGDMTQLAAAVTELIERPDRREHMGRAARAAVERTFSIESVGHRMLDLYQSLVPDGVIITGSETCAG